MRPSSIFEKGDDIGEYVIGVDESGRSTVFGSLVYCGFFSEKKYSGNFLSEMGVKDSKKLSQQRREELFERLQETKGIGWLVKTISPDKISELMFRREKKNLNRISYEIVLKILNNLIKKIGHPPKTIYLDAVGLEEDYRCFLSPHFPLITMVIEPNADSKYPIVGAASNIARFVFDKEMKSIKTIFEEKEGDIPMGSGNSGDKATMDWLEFNCDPVFGYPGDIVRLSWGPVIKIIQEKCVKVKWLEESVVEVCSVWMDEQEKRKEKKREATRKQRLNQKAKKRSEKGLSVPLEKPPTEIISLIKPKISIPGEYLPSPNQTNISSHPKQNRKKTGTSTPFCLYQSSRSIPKL